MTNIVNDISFKLLKLKFSERKQRGDNKKTNYLNVKALNVRI